MITSVDCGGAGVLANPCAVLLHPIRGVHEATNPGELALCAIELMIGST